MSALEKTLFKALTPEDYIIYTPPPGWFIPAWPFCLVREALKYGGLIVLFFFQQFFHDLVILGHVMVARSEKPLWGDIVSICAEFGKKSEEVLGRIVQRYRVVTVPGVQAG